MFRSKCLWMTVAVVGMFTVTMAVADDAKKDDGVLAGPKVKDRGNPKGPNMMAGGPTTRPGGEFKERVEVIRQAVAKLDLTDVQREKIKADFEEFHKKAEAFRDAHRDELEKLQAELKTARETNNSDKAKEIRKQINQILEQGPKPMELAQKVRSELTAEQQGKFDADIKDRFQKKDGGPATRPSGADGPRNRPKGDGPPTPKNTNP